MTVELSGVTIQYKDVTAVTDFNLRIEDGELVVLLGPSGCGKTSVMRSIVGLEHPSAGTITVDGRVVYDAQKGIDVPVHRRRLGMVFQSYAIWPHMTVIQNVSFPLRVARSMSKKEIRIRAQEVLGTVGLAEFADRPASMLSGGQMQRVALARSIAMNPRVMLLDEPLSNLDAKLRDRLRLELKEFHDRLGMTALYVTHDLAEALALGDRVVVMDKGTIVQIGSPREVYAHPGSPYVADFLGMTNLFRGVVTEVADSRGEVLVTVTLVDSDTRVVAQIADPTAAPTVGSELVVCLPSEHMELRGGADDNDSPNNWSAEVATENYLGTQTRFRVSTDSGLELDVLAFGKDAGLHTGGPVRVTVDPAFVQLLPAEVSR